MSNTLSKRSDARAEIPGWMVSFPPKLWNVLLEKYLCWSNNENLLLHTVCHCQIPLYNIILHYLSTNYLKFFLLKNGGKYFRLDLLPYLKISVYFLGFPNLKYWQMQQLMQLKQKKSKNIVLKNMVLLFPNLKSWQMQQLMQLKQK